MPRLADGDVVGTQIDVPSGGTSAIGASTGAPQLAYYTPYFPSPSGGALAGFLPSSDAVSARSSPYSSSAPSPCSSYSYNRADFPLENEIEEFMSPSFEWPSSSSASFGSRQDRLADAVQPPISRRQLLLEVRDRTDHLLRLLRRVKELPQVGTDPYERPRRRIMDDTQNVLNKALAFVTKGNLIRRVFTVIPANSLMKISLQLENAIGNVSWLLGVSNPYNSVADDGRHLGLPPIATDEPVLYLIWQQVAKLLKGSPEDKADAAASLVSLARGDGRYGELIIEEGGVGPLLQLIKAGNVDAQERAAHALGLLGRHPRSFVVMAGEGAISVFTRVLKEGPTKVQAMVAWAVSELAADDFEFQMYFAKDNVVQLLVRHLAFEMVQEPATKSRMKAMAARALWALALGNSSICKSITESRALLSFAVLLDKGTEEVRSNSAIAVMEIARVAEEDADLRRFAFKPTSPAAKAVVDQLLRIVQKAEYSSLLVPSIVALGCLSKTFRATETRIIGPLVRLLDEREPEVMLEAAVALTKFSETDNYLHKDHCKAIIDEGGVKHLVQLVYLGEVVQMPALILLCYVAKHVPDSEELKQAEVLTVLDWASKQSDLAQADTIDWLLPEAKSQLEEVLTVLPA